MKKKYYIESGEGVLSELGVDFFPQVLPAERVVFAHIHPAVEILFITGGRGYVSLDDRVLTVGEGALVLIRSNVVHRISPVPTEGLRYYVLKVHPRVFFDFSSPSSGAVYTSFFSSLCSDPAADTVFSVHSDGMIENTLERLVGTLSVTEEWRDFELKAASAELLLALYRSSPVRAGGEADRTVGSNVIRSIYDATVYIKDHFTEDVTAADCAAAVNMSYSYFSRMFRRVTGKSFGLYLNILRTNLAEEKLHCSDDPITKIAFDCGFSDCSYFISVYHKLHGITPLAERARGKGGRAAK